MKTVAVTEFLLVVALLAVAYLVWVQQQQLAELELDFDRIRAAVSDLAKPPTPKPRAPRTPKPKETTK